MKLDLYDGGGRGVEDCHKEDECLKPCVRWWDRIRLQFNLCARVIYPASIPASGDPNILTGVVFQSQTNEIESVHQFTWTCWDILILEMCECSGVTEVLQKYQSSNIYCDFAAPGF